MIPCQDSGKEKAHKHKQICPVIAWVSGGLPTGWPGVKCLCAREDRWPGWPSPPKMARYPPPVLLPQRAPGLKKFNLERQYWKNQAFNMEWNFQSRMIFSFHAPLWPQKNRDWNFQSRMKISNREWTFHARMKISCGGEWFFHAFEWEWFFFDLRALWDHPNRKRYMRILLFWDLNYEFHPHAHTWKILTAIDFELDTHTSRFSQEFIM